MSPCIEIKSFTLSNAEGVTHAENFVCQSFTNLDLSFDPSFQACFSQIFGWDVRMLYCTIGEKRFIKFARFGSPNIPNCPIGLDMSSTYGHGGWMSNTAHDEADLTQLKVIENHFLEKSEIITEYCELLDQKNGLIDLRLHTEHCDLKKNVLWIDLRPPAADLWSSIKEKQRKSIVSSLRKGVYIDTNLQTFEKAQRFDKNYQAFIKTKETNSFWHFPKGFFSHFYQVLKGRVECIDAWWQENLVGSFFVLLSGKHAYYFFSYSDSNYRELNCNSLLMFYLMMNLKKRGFESLYLGGGVRSGDDDPLFRFKKSFGGCEKNYFVMKRIVDEQKYKNIISKHPEFSAKTDFFPPYGQTGF